MVTKHIPGEELDAVLVADVVDLHHHIPGAAGQADLGMAMGMTLFPPGSFNAGWEVMPCEGFGFPSCHSSFAPGIWEYSSQFWDGAK